MILVRPDTSTADIAGFAASAGIVTATGGTTAHAALVARKMGKPCIVGCSGLAVDTSARRAHAGSFLIEEGDWISIDGDSGDLFVGQLEILTERPVKELAEIERWRASSPARAENLAGAAV